MAAYRIVKNAAAWWPVRWNEVDDDGAIVEREISLRFIRVGETEIDAWYEKPNIDFIMGLAIDWRGPANEGGTALAFTRENALQMLDVANFPEALGKAYVAFFRARAETRLGNSAAPPAAGPAATPAAAPAPATATA